MPGAELDIVDREGQPITEPDKGGLLVITKPFPHFYRTVFGDPERQAQDWNTIPGVYLTGDVALRDADGYYMVVGRADDVLNVAGHRIGSAEVESALVSNAAVAEAAVIGIPDEKYGEQVMAWVQLKPGTSLTEEDVKEFCRSHIAHFKVPAHVAFVDDYPMTVTGKIQKFKLREMAIKDLGLESAAKTVTA